MANRKKITLPVLRNRKKNNKKISWITAYDFATASFAEEAGILNSLTPSRSNGFRTMFDMVQSIVREAI